MASELDEMEPPEVAAEILGGDVAEASQETLDLAVAAVHRLDVRRRRPRDPVAPAKPTPHARGKKARRRTGDGLALQSLDTLLAELATRCRNTCWVLADPTVPPFSLLTQPTEIQRRVAELIEMFPVQRIA